MTRHVDYITNTLVIALSHVPRTGLAYGRYLNNILSDIFHSPVSP